MKRFKFLFFLTTVLSSNFTFLAKGGLCSSKEALSGNILVNVIINRSQVFSNFEITPEDTYPSLELKIQEKLENKTTKNFRSLPLAIQQVLKEREITELPLALDILTRQSSRQFKTGNNLFARLRIALGDSLKGADFTDADFGYADFTDADLRDVNFTRANLTRVNFTRANLRNAILDGAIIRTTYYDPSGANSMFRGFSAQFTDALVSDAQLNSTTTIHIQGKPPEPK